MATLHLYLCTIPLDGESDKISSDRVDYALVDPYVLLLNGQLLLYFHSSLLSGKKLTEFCPYTCCDTPSLPICIGVPLTHMRKPVWNILSLVLNPAVCRAVQAGFSTKCEVLQSPSSPG